MYNGSNMQKAGFVSRRKKQDPSCAADRKRTKRKWMVRAAVICCIALIVGITAVVNGRKAGRRAMAIAVGPKTAAVERRTLTESVSATGKITSLGSKTVTASVTGVEVKSVEVKAGDMVSEGDVIYVLDSSALEQNLADAKVSLASAQGKTQISISSAQRSLEEAQASRNRR